MLLNTYYGPIRKIYLGNFNCEDFWRDKETMQLPAVDLHHIKPLIQNLDELFLFISGSEDILILRNKPEQHFLEYIHALGVELPHIIAIAMNDDKKTISELILQDEELVNRLKQFVEKNAKANIITELVPYGVTLEEEELAARISARLRSNSYQSSYFNCKLTIAKLASKCKIAIPESIICGGIEELQSKGIEFAKIHGQIVLKELYGSGGSGIFKIKGAEELRKCIEGIKRRIRPDGRIIVEKWYPSRISYNHQYLISEGRIFDHAFSEQLINDSGNINGSVFNHTKKVNSQKKIHNELSKPLLEEILHSGYQGVVGFDSIICNHGLIFPVVDINCRINLSTIFYEITKKYFRSNYASFFYKEYKLEQPKPFFMLIDKIGNDAYTLEKGEGILILNFSSLNSNILNYKGRIGRIFFAVFAKSEQKAKKMIQRL